jgi:hypothetical protein
MKIGMWIIVSVVLATGEGMVVEGRITFSGAI